MMTQNNQVAQTEARQAKKAQVKAFMFDTTIKKGWYEETPAERLREQGADIGLSGVVDEWLINIINSEDPGGELAWLIDHLAGLLSNAKLIRKHFRKQFEQAA